jgi:hypothetical protein
VVRAVVRDIERHLVVPEPQDKVTQAEVQEPANKDQAVVAEPVE